MMFTSPFGSWRRTTTTKVFDAIPQHTGSSPTPTPATAHFSSGLPAKLPVIGYHVDLTTRDSGSGARPVSWSRPTVGCRLLCLQFLSLQSLKLVLHPGPTVSSHSSYLDRNMYSIEQPPNPPHHNNPKRPSTKGSLSSFVGDNPRGWCTRAKKYFNMYSIEQSLWISVSKMNFDGPASLWYQSIEPQVAECSWSDFIALIHDHFDWDRHESLICQLFHIKETSTVTDYVSRFIELGDPLIESLSPQT